MGIKHFSIRPPRFFLNKPVRETYLKDSICMILTNNTKWVSSQLFLCGWAKLRSQQRKHLHKLFITELLLVWPVGHMDRHITDWVTKPSQLPWTGNPPICQVVYISIFCLHTLLDSQEYNSSSWNSICSDIPKRLNNCEEIC